MEYKPKYSKEILNKSRETGIHPSALLHSELQRPTLLEKNEAKEKAIHPTEKPVQKIMINVIVGIVSGVIAGIILWYVL